MIRLLQEIKDITGLLCRYIVSIAYIVTIIYGLLFYVYYNDMADLGVLVMFGFICLLFWLYSIVQRFRQENIIISIYICGTIIAFCLAGANHRDESIILYTITVGLYFIFFLAAIVIEGIQSYTNRPHQEPIQNKYTIYIDNHLYRYESIYTTIIRTVGGMIILSCIARYIYAGGWKELDTTGLLIIPALIAFVVLVYIIQVCQQRYNHHHVTQELVDGTFITREPDGNNGKTNENMTLEGVWTREFDIPTKGTKGTVRQLFHHGETSDQYDVCINETIVHKKNEQDEYYIYTAGQAGDDRYISNIRENMKIEDPRDKKREKSIYISDVTTQGFCIYFDKYISGINIRVKRLLFWLGKDNTKYATQITHYEVMLYGDDISNPEIRAFEITGANNKLGIYIPMGEGKGYKKSIVLWGYNANKQLVCISPMKNIKFLPPTPTPPSPH